MPNPKISVVMPSYNQANYLEEAIESVLNQPYENVELIIVDGLSTDGSVDIIHKYKKRANVKAIVEKDNGQADALQKGFLLCSGEIYAWLNSDDVYAPDAFRRVVETFEQHPQAEVVNGELHVINEHSAFVAVWPRKKVPAKQWVHHPQPIGQPSTFFRATLYKKVGGVNSMYRYAMDYDLFFRFALAKARFHYIDDCLALFRVHSQSKTMFSLPYKFWREDIAIYYKLTKGRLWSGFYYWKFRGMLSAIVKQKILKSRKF